jgi:hypothetical protein
MDVSERRLAARLRAVRRRRRPIVVIRRLGRAA